MTDGTSDQTLQGFFLARIAEDEAAADYFHNDACETHAAPEIGGFPCNCHYPARILAECQAKRRVRSYQIADEVDRVLAAVYADHPDYREEWRP